MIAVSRDQPILDDFEDNPFNVEFEFYLYTFPHASVTFKFQVPPGMIPAGAYQKNRIERTKLLKSLTRGKRDDDITIILRSASHSWGDDYMEYSLPELLNDKLFLETIFGKTTQHFIDACRRFKNVLFSKRQQQLP